MEWISVRDRLPPEENILCFGSCKTIHVGHWRNGEHCHVECCYEDGTHFTGEEFSFTHWMPMPPPP